jgi:hypothetical protein
MTKGRKDDEAPLDSGPPGLEIRGTILSFNSTNSLATKDVLLAASLFRRE